MARLGLLVLAMLLLALVGPSAARACSGLWCFHGTFFPREGTVPENLQGIYWWPSYESGEDGGTEGTDHVRLARVDGSEPELIAFTLQPIPRELANREGYLLIPETPFVAGASYVAWDTGCQDFSETAPPPVPDRQVVSDEDRFSMLPTSVEIGVARFMVAAEAPHPTELGELRASEQASGDVWVADSSECSVRLEVIHSDLQLSLADAAEPWADALFYATVVDGERYEPQGGAQIDYAPGTSLAGRATDRIYVTCEGGLREGVRQGTHRVELIAHIPGSANQLAASETRVTLMCPTKSDGGSDGAVDDGDGGAGDASADSGATQPPDGEGTRDAGSAGSDSGGGCDCSTTGAAGTANALWIACAVLWLTRRRARTAR